MEAGNMIGKGSKIYNIKSVDVADSNCKHKVKLKCVEGRECLSG